jgi:hypothetical protein
LQSQAAIFAAAYREMKVQAKVTELQKQLDNYSAAVASLEVELEQKVCLHFCISKFS